MEWYNKSYDDAPENLDIIDKLTNIQYQLRDYKLAEKSYIKLIMADNAKKYP